MRTSITIIICLIALVSVKAFENLLEKHALITTHEVKRVRTFAAMGPNITSCFDDDVKDFATCVINAGKKTQ